MISTLYQLIRHWSKASPESVALAGTHGIALTFAALDRLVGDVVESLNGWGVGPGDRVALMLPNGPESASAFLAVSSGATCAPLNPRYGADELRFYLDDIGARLLIVWQGLDSPARAVAGELGVPTVEFVPAAEGEAGRFDLVGDVLARRAAPRFAEPEDVALVLHTSGTTSRPKLVPLTHAMLCASARNVAVTLELTPDDRCLNIMPLFHIHGLVGALLSSLSAGGSVACTPGLRADAFFGWLDALLPSWYTGVPTMHQEILVAAASHREIVERRVLRLIRSSSAALPVSILERLESELGTKVIEAYGMTEASHQIASNPLPPRTRAAGSVGLPSGPEVRTVDDAGGFLPPGEVGEIVIRGDTVIRAYETAGANEDSFLDGWLRTGDRGRIDSDGYVYLIGRLKELINRGGEKVSPLEVDEVLLGHEDVAQAAAFAVPHATLGEDVAAAVVLSEGRSCSATQLREHCFGRLAGSKIPSRILIVDEIPKGPTGKIQRIGLAKALASQLTPAFRPPTSPEQVALATIWAAVLRVPPVGLDDNFFSLGGDSLSAARVVSRIEHAFEVRLPLSSVFRDPTLDGMALNVAALVLSEIEAGTGDGG